VSVPVRLTVSVCGHDTTDSEIEGTIESLCSDMFGIGMYLDYLHYYCFFPP
jgi:hypothetical protein